MPYVNIPKSKITFAVATIVGKLYGNLSNQIAATSLEMTNKYRREACPTELVAARNRGKIIQLQSTISKTQRRLEKFKRLPKALKIPIKGFKAALKVILTLPIPQAVPPGIGIPVSITTKYADILHLIKEKIAQVEEDVEGIELILTTPDNFSKGISRQLARLDTATSTCEFENSLKKDLDEGLVTEEELKKLGIMDEEGILITSKLLPSIVGGGNTSTPDGSSEEDLTSATNEFTLIVSRLEKSNVSDKVKGNVKNILDGFSNLYKSNPEIQTAKGDILYTAPTGEVFVLTIVKDMDSPTIAPRRYAVALDREGVQVLAGPKSFSSNTDVLIEEIKFRIDNQLP